MKLKLPIMGVFTLICCFFTTSNLNAQSRTCPPTDPAYCTSPCMEIESITNNTDCDLTFYWLYQGTPCSGNIGAGTVPATGTPTPAFPWQADCKKFCDYDCECPTGFWMVDPSNPLSYVNPWDAMWAMAVGTVVTYCNLSSCTTNCTGLFKATVTKTGPNSISIVFECQTGICP